MKRKPYTKSMRKKRDLYTQYNEKVYPELVYNGAPAADEDPADYVRLPKAVRLG